MVVKYLIKMKNNILVAGSGNITGINIIKALIVSEHNFVIGCDFNELNPANKYCENLVVSKCNLNSYLNEILKIIDDYKIKYIFTSNDHELRVLVNNISILTSRNVYLNGFSINTLKFLNKIDTNNLFVDNDILTPKEYQKDKITFPVVIRKNEMGDGQKFVYIVNSSEDLFKIPESQFENAIYTEYIEGPEYTIDVVCSQDSKVYSAVPRLRKEVRNGMVFFAEIENNDSVINNTIKLAEQLKLTGVNCIQCILNNNKCYFIEVNPRPGSGMDLSIVAGVNMPQIWIDLMSNKKIEYKEPEWGLKMLRHYDGYYFK
jgi:carbamoyl-phosphate synthase large subunit